MARPAPAWRGPAAAHAEGEGAHGGCQPAAGSRPSWLDQQAASAPGSRHATEMQRSQQQAAHPAAQRARGTEHSSRKAPHIREVPGQAEACAQVVVGHLLKNHPEAAAEHLDAEVGKLARTSCKAFYHSLIHSCGLLGSPRSAMWCAVQMVRMGLKPNIVTFNSLMDTCAKTRNLGLAKEVWDIMTDTGVPPNLITYNTIINCCSQACDAESANRWLEKMLEDNFSPDTVTFGAMVSLCARTGDVEVAEAWLRRMDQSGAKADRVIFNSLISACAKAGQPAKAEQWMMQMQARHWRPDEKTFSSVIQACTKAGVIERAEYWLERMLEEGFSPDKMTFGAVVQVCGKGSRVARAMYWLDYMASYNIALDLASFNAVLAALATAGDMPGAAQWLKKMTEARAAPYRTNFIRLLEVASSMQDMDAAETCIQEMIKNRMHPDRGTLRLLVEAASRTACPEDQRSAWALGVIILAYVHIGAIDLAMQWRRDMADSGMERFSALFDSILSSGGAMRQTPRPGDASAAVGDTSGAAGASRDTWSSTSVGDTSRSPVAACGGSRSFAVEQASAADFFEDARPMADSFKSCPKTQPGSSRETCARRELNNYTIDDLFAIVDTQRFDEFTSAVSL